MTTFRQFERGVVRTMRAVEREAQRREKLRQAELALGAAGAYAQLVRDLVEAHRSDFERRDWSLAHEMPRAEPARNSGAETAAVAVRDAYRPGPLSRALGFAERRRRRLERAVGEARDRDEAAHLEACEAVRVRNAEIGAAAAIAALEPSATMGVIERLSVDGRLPIALKGLSLEFGGDRLVVVAVGVDVDDLPSESVTLLQSGRASYKALSKTRLHEMHRDALCALAVRMALEILQALPIEAVDVVVSCRLLDRGSGMLVLRPVIELGTTVQALSSVNLARAEPSFLVEHLGGRFAWNKRDGFQGMV